MLQIKLLQFMEIICYMTYVQLFVILETRVSFYLGS